MRTGVQEHYRRIKNILLWILVLNWSVALVKILYGLFSRCASMTADGFHSLSDGASNIVGLIGISIASQPKDKEHPYGHKKYETFFSLCIAGLLGVVCFHLIEEAIKRLRNPVSPQIDAASFIVMLVTLGINLLVMNYEYKQGSLLRSDILISDSMHTKTDILTSLSVIVTLVMIRLGYPILDPLVTIIIALFIAYAAFNITRQSSKILCDTIAIVDVKKIINAVLAIKGVKTCHKIRTRGRPDDIHLDMHIQVRPNMHMDEAHKISYTVEEELKKSFPEVTDVVVHMEPEEKA